MAWAGNNWAGGPQGGAWASGQQGGYGKGGNAQWGAAVAAPAAGLDVGPPPLSVTGCQNPTVSNIIQGSYKVQGLNHSKPVYKKDPADGDSVEVLIYFWDERDGAAFSGWWFGPKVGGDQVWAYNINRASPTPPNAGWKVPWDGPVDETFRVTPVTLQQGMSSGMPGMAALANQAWPGDKRPFDGTAGVPPQVVPPRNVMPRLGNAMDPATAQMMEQERQRQMAQAGMERMAREEEMRRRQMSKADEMKRRQEELRKKREEEETKRKEQSAALVVRKVIQRVRIATPDNFEELRAELEKTQTEQLEAMGPQVEKVLQEAEKALKQAQERVDEINKKRVDEENRKAEEEEKKKLELERVQALANEVKEKADAAFAKVELAEKAAKALEGNPEEHMPDDAIEKQLGETDAACNDAKAALEEVSAMVPKKRSEMGNSEASYERQKEIIVPVMKKMVEVRRTLDRLKEQNKATRDRLQRKMSALRKEKEQKEAFAKHDSDGDGKLSREEIVAFAKGEYGFDCPPEVVDKAIKTLGQDGGISFEKFPRLRSMVAIAKSEEKAREKKKELEERKLSIKAAIDVANEALKEVDQALTAMDKTAHLIMEHGKATKGTSEELATAISETETEAGSLRQAIANTSEKLEEVKAACGEDAEAKSFARLDVPRIQARIAQAKIRLEKVEASVTKATETVTRKAFAEVEALRGKVVTAIRARMMSEEKTSEALFESISGGALSREKFCKFLVGLPDLEVDEPKAGKLFDHLVGGSETLSKELFVETVRLFYKVVKPTVLTESVTIRSTTLRRLEIGEPLEALEGPKTEEATQVQRVRVRAAKDMAEGWVTVSGNQGTVFLEIGGNTYACVKETILTDDLSVSEGKEIRKVAKGEVFEVLEFEKQDPSADLKRMKGKAKLDGATGWITVTGSTGDVFMEAC